MKSRFCSADTALVARRWRVGATDNTGAGVGAPVCGRRVCAGTCAEALGAPAVSVVDCLAGGRLNCT